MLCWMGQGLQVVLGGPDGVAEGGDPAELDEGDCEVARGPDVPGMGRHGCPSQTEAFLGQRQRLLGVGVLQQDRDVA